MKSTRDIVPGFGDRIRKAREAKGWSQAELAEKAGTHPQTVSDIEREYRSVSLRLSLSLAKALGTPVGLLAADGISGSSTAKSLPEDMIMLKGIIDRWGKDQVLALVQVLTMSNEANPV